MTMLDLDARSTLLREYLAELDAASLKPPPTITPIQWAESPEGWIIEKGPIKGPFRVSNFEVARGPMANLLRSGVSQISIMASAQIMKTSTFQLAIAFIMAMSPRDVVAYFPTDDLAKKFVREKLEPMIEGSPALREVFGGLEALAKKREDYTDKSKVFPGGSINIGSAENPRSLAMITVDFMGFDEIAKAKVTTGGDPLSLGLERGKNSPIFQALVTSTPEDEGDIISREWLKGDQRKPYVQCPNPECREWHYFTWENFSYKTGEEIDLLNAGHECPHCRTRWTEAERIKALTTPHAISWRQTRPFSCCGERQEPEVTRLWTMRQITDGTFGHATCTKCGATPVSERHQSYWAWEGYHPRVSSEELARAWLDAQGSRGELEAFIKSKLARTFKRQEEARVQIKADTLRAREEPAWTWLPDATKWLTAGVDVHPDRIEGEVVAWGPGDESWSIEYIVLEGDTSQQHVWYALDEALKRKWQFADGREMGLAAACVDAGDQTDTVLAFTQPRRNRRIWAVMGTDGKAGTRKTIWPVGGRMSVKKGGRSAGSVFFGVGGQSAKDRFADQIKVPAPGPGYVHVPTGRPDRWFDQLAAEIKVKVEIGGRTAYYWKKKHEGIRNEALDCRVYAICALEGLRAMGLISALSAPSAAAGPRHVTEDGELLIGDAAVAAMPAPVRRKPKIRFR